MTCLRGSARPQSWSTSASSTAWARVSSPRRSRHIGTCGWHPPERAPVRSRRHSAANSRTRSPQSELITASPSGGAFAVRGPAMNDRLADRSLVDLIERLDAVRELHEQADTADALQRAQTLVDDALRQATNFLFELRRKQLGI